MEIHTDLLPAIAKTTAHMQMMKQIKQKSAGSGVAGAPAPDPMEILVQAIENAKPLIETRPVRVGGSMYQVLIPYWF